MSEKQRELELLQAVTTAANNAATLEEALQATLDRICVHTACEIGHAYRVSDENPDELVSAKIWHRQDSDLYDSFCRFSEAARLAGGCDLPVRVWEGGLPLWIADIRKELDCPRAQLADEAGLKSAFAVPILVENQVVGVMEFYCRRPQVSTEHLLDVFRFVGQQLGRTFERHYAQGNILRAYAELELRVNERTADLVRTNASLQAEISERRKAEAAMRASEERFDLAVRGSNDGIWDWNMLTNEVYFSLRFKELLGYADEEFENDFQSFESHVHPDDFDFVINRVYKHIWEREPFDVEFRMRTKAGDYRWFRTRAQAVWKGDQRASRMAGSLSDITDRKRADAEIRAALERERELGELKSRFVSMASHEFRTPLTTILAASDLLKRYNHKMTEAERVQRLNKIQDEVKHMTDMLNDVLIYGRAGAGKDECKPSSMDVRLFCESLCADLQASAGDRLCFSFTGVCPEVMMDERALRHILTNVLSNAIKYSQGRGSILFEVERENGAVRFAIKDQGIGIPEADLQRLFEPFHRAANASNISGTGLGLAIVKNAVELHGGTIDVQSTVGVGTTFVITIPAQACVD